MLQSRATRTNTYTPPRRKYTPCGCRSDRRWVELLNASPLDRMTKRGRVRHEVADNWRLAALTCFASSGPSPEKIGAPPDAEWVWRPDRIRAKRSTIHFDERLDHVRSGEFGSELHGRTAVQSECWGVDASGGMPGNGPRSGASVGTRSLHSVGTRAGQ